MGDYPWTTAPNGSGKPLILLHGQFATASMFDPILPELAHHRQVVLIEQQGHGHTADINRPLSLLNWVVIPLNL